MLLDLTPLTVSHLVYFGLSFALAWAAIVFVLRQPKPWLRLARPQIYFAGVIVVAITAALSAYVVTDPRLRLGLLLAAIVTLLIGTLDEIHSLHPGHQLLWQAIIAAIAAGSGWVIRYVSAPQGTGVIDVGLSTAWLPLGFLLTIIWFVLLMNAMNWLDGVDGLSSGVGLVGFFTLAAVALLPSVQDSRTLYLAVIGGGVMLGFFVWNFAPARVYLGTTGSWWLGLMLGATAIVGGGKIATTLLVLSLPVFDALLVIFQRIWHGRKPWQGDQNSHLHHKLLARGWSQRSISLSAMLFSVLLAMAALTLQTSDKLLALSIAAALIGVLSISILGTNYVTIKSKP